MIMFMLLILYSNISLCKKILFVDSSSLTSGNGDSLNNPLNNLESAFSQASDDLEIEILSNTNPYVINSSYSFAKSFKLFSSKSPRPQLLVTQSACLEFFSNVSIKGLMISSNQVYKGNQYKALLNFGGREGNLERELLMLEIANIEFNQGGLISGSALGSFKLADIKITKIKAMAQFNGAFFNISYCDDVLLQNITISEIDFSNFTLLLVGCPLRADSLSIIQGSFKSSGTGFLFGISQNFTHLTNCLLAKNIFNYVKIFGILRSFCDLSIESTSIIDNADNTKGGSFLILSRESNSKLYFSNSSIKNNYAAGTFIDIASENSLIMIANVTISSNSYLTCFRLKGPKLVISISHLHFTENNNNNSFFLSQNYAFGQALFIEDYISVSIAKLGFLNNRAGNTLQGLGLAIGEIYRKEVLENKLSPEVSIGDFICKGNQGYHSIPPNYFGNCMNLQFLGKIKIFKSLFDSNELDLSSELSVGATSPCIHALGVKNELIVIDTVFNNNRGVDGCYCFDFEGESILFINAIFTNIRSTRNNNSMFNMAGALSLGAKIIEINGVLIAGCSARKAAGVLFQNGGEKMTVITDGLVIKLNVAKQSSGIEFDAALPMGTFVFNKALLESNVVEFYGVVALFFKTIINITFTNSQFINNSGATAGSLFTLLNIQGEMFLFDSEFYNNSLLGSKIFVGGSVALVYGGALYTYIHFHRCYFKKNFCSSLGGAVAVKIGNLHINNSVFENNSAAFGGCLTSGLSSQMILFNTSFVGNLQDVEIKEAAAIFVNDETLTRIINCTFFKLKAIASAAIQLYGINSRLEIYSCLFLWNSAMQGAIIFVFNRFMGWPIYIYNCLMQGNSVEKELIYLRNIRIIVVNFTVNQNIGKANTLIHVELKFQFFSILNHVCQSKIDYGCFASISMGSNAEFYKTSFHNVSSGFERDFFQIKGSSVIINDLIYNNVNTKSEFGVSYAQNSNLTLASLNIKHLTSNLVFLEKSAFEINASCFYNITQHANFKFGAIQGHSSSRFLVSYCNFSLISTSSLGGIFYLLKGEGKSESFVMKNNVFSDSSALAGGVVYAEEQSLKFVNNFASNMSVAEDGGVTFLSTTRKSLVQWTITGNNFSLNTARKGGCIHSLGKLPQGISNNSYKNNFAQYGPDYSSFAVRLSLEKIINHELITLNCSELEEKCFIKNVGSGLPFDSIIVSLIDTYGQKMVLEETVGSIELAYKLDYNPTSVYGKGNIPDMLSSPSESTILKGMKSIKSNQGVLNFSELLLIATPKSKVVLRVETQSIAEFMPEFVSKSSACDQFVLIGNRYHFLFIVQMRDCVRGEIHLIKENVCYPCPEGKYSVDTKDKQCSMCPENAFCEGKDRIIVKHGYWRSSVNSTKIWECNVVSDPCLGGYESLCKEGYTSVVCGSCEFQDDANQYFKNGLFFCYSCKELYKYVLVLLAGVFALIFALVFLVWYKQKRIRNIKEGALMKLLISHIHVTAFISNLRITFPDILQTFSSVQSPTTSTETFVFTMDCFKNKFQIPLFAVKLLLSMVIVLCILLMIGLAFFIIMKRKKVPVEESLINMLNALVIIAMFLQPMFINFYLQMLSCVSYENSYMVNYLDEKCWEGNHLIFSLAITIPMLIFWSLIYPGSFLTYLYRKRRTLDDPKVTRITIFFRAGFREKYYFWEFVIMSRKLIVVIITSLFGSEVEFVIYLIIPIIGFYCALQIYVRPYVQKNFNLLEILSLNATFITYYSAIFYLKTSSWLAKLVFVILIIGVNIVFIFLWVHQYFVKMKNIIVQRRTKKSIQLIELPPISDGSSKQLSALGSDSNLNRMKLKFLVRDVE